MSDKLQKIILLSLLLNLLHMIEVYSTGYYLTGFGALEPFFANMSSAIYFSSHIFLYLGITLFFLSHINKKFFTLGLVAYSWVFISESHHFIRAILTGSYFPGSITSLLYIVIGIAYITQLRSEAISKKL